MRVNLIDIDGKAPNLALMKLSSHWKSQGADVALNSIREADKTFISVVFDYNLAKAKKVASFTGGELGGSGTGDHSIVLPEDPYLSTVLRFLFLGE